jgi:fructokinase
MTTTPTITCFGEVLWDVLPTGKQAGGAPMNVALHLRNFGLDAQLISRVGTDDLGRELLNFMHEKGLPTTYVQVGHSHLTGVAKANVDDANEVTYKIVQPVAWDYIQLEPGLLEAVQQRDYFVYGSLAARSPQTHETLMTLLAVAKNKVFDVNLRAPHYTRATITELIQQADIVKLNEHELAELSGWSGAETDLQRCMNQFRQQYQLDTVCVTLGAAGAAMLNDDVFVRQSGFPVRVADTIGSGDAFLAAFLYKTGQGLSPQHVLRFACATGAYVASQQGATPYFSEETIVNQLVSVAAV